MGRVPVRRAVIMVTLRRLALTLLVLVLALLPVAPIAWIETACRPQGDVPAHAAILPPGDHRPESRTLLTYPEWHIVHAYDDYARVIRDGDPHDFGYLRAIGGFWSSLCAVSRASGPHGGFPADTKQMVYTIGVSFSAELLAKAAWEETIGRMATWLRGPERAALDDLSAEQAAAYAVFLQQVPWYQWDFRKDAAAIDAADTGGLRNRERHFALGLEYRVKAAYARLIARAVEGVGADALRLRMVVTGLTPDRLAGYEGVSIVGQVPEGSVIETPRYRELTGLLRQMAEDGADFIEIAGNDDIMLTVISDRADRNGALFSFARQGYGDWRHLMLVKVRDLGAVLQGIAENGAGLEHIHDY